MQFFTWTCLIFLLGSPALSQTVNELTFPAQKNNVQILPQRFEYRLIDKDQVRIGDIVVNAQDIDFNVKALTSGRYRVTFRWPSSLVQDGEIAIKDPSGKAIWSQKIQPEKTRKQRKNKIEADERDDGLQSFETTANTSELIRQLKMYPFFKFCVHHEEPRTKLYLCSKDLYIQKDQEGFNISSRDSLRPQSFVEINGRPVSAQGAIFLNSTSEDISLRALLLSGATLELDTRMKDVRFKDVVLSDDEKKIIILAQGAEPADPQAVQRKNADEWSTELDVERPFTYLRGEGGIPLRQEFLINGPLRKESLHVFILGKEIPRTVRSSKLELNLKALPGMELRSADKRTSLRKTGDQNYTWTLLGLRRNERNVRYVKVIDGGREYIAAYDVERATSIDTYLRLMYPLWGQAHGSWLLNPRWELEGQWDQQLAKGSGDTDFQFLTVGGLWHFSEADFTERTGYSVGGNLQQIQTNIKGITTAGVTVISDLRNKSIFGRELPWIRWQLRLPLLAADTDFKLKTSYDAELAVRYPQSNSSYWEGGLKMEKYLLQSDTADISLSRTHAFLGVGWIF